MVERYFCVVEHYFCRRALLWCSSATLAFFLKVASGDHFFHESWDLSLCTMLDFCEVVESYSCRRILQLYSKGTLVESYSCIQRLLLSSKATLVLRSYSCRRRLLLYFLKLLLSSKATLVFRRYSCRRKLLLYPEATLVVESHFHFHAA